MRISLEVEKLQTDWPVFVSGAGQRGDYAKQETVEIKWKILSRKVGCIIKITIKKKIKIWMQAFLVVFWPLLAQPSGRRANTGDYRRGEEAASRPAQRARPQRVLLRRAGGGRGGVAGRRRGAVAPQKATHCARHGEPALRCQPRKQMPSRCLLEMLPLLPLSEFISKPADFLPFLIELKMYLFSSAPPTRPRPSARRH